MFKPPTNVLHFLSHSCSKTIVGHSDRYLLIQLSCQQQLGLNQLYVSHKTQSLISPISQRQLTPLHISYMVLIDSNVSQKVDFTPRV